jgi:hypothetical protein
MKNTFVLLFYYQIVADKKYICNAVPNLNQVQGRCKLNERIPNLL